MDRTLVFAILAMIPTIFAYRRIIKLVTDPSSTVAPNLASWIVWGTVDASILASSIYAGMWTTMGVFVVYTFGCLAIILLVLKKGTMEWTRFDIGCLVVSGIAFLGWMVSGDPAVAILLNVLVAVVGSIPTIKQSWLTPEKEDILVWQLLTLGGFLNLGAVSAWTLTGALAPVVVFMIQINIVAFLTIKTPRQVPASL